MRDAVVWVVESLTSETWEKIERKRKRMKCMSTTTQHSQRCVRIASVEALGPLSSRPPSPVGQQGEELPPTASPGADIKIVLRRREVCLRMKTRWRSFSERKHVFILDRTRARTTMAGP